MALMIETMDEERAIEERTGMRTLLVETGDPGQLQLVEEAVPEPQRGEVRLRVLASGVAYADIMCRRGAYPLMPKLPFTPGYDLVGVVDALGEDVTVLHENQVAAALLPKFGANAEFVCLPQELCVPLPEGVMALQATAVILNYLTAYSILQDKAEAQAGEIVLVHSAAGGVGTALLQLGREMGLQMMGTASPGKLALVAAQGATPIDYRSEDFTAVVQDLAGAGIDIVCDPVGGEMMVRSYGLLRKGGRLVNYGMLGAGGGKTAVLSNMAHLAWYAVKPDGKRAMFFGSTPSIAAKNPAWYRESLAALLDMLAAGQIDPVIGTELPLVEIARAHQMLEDGEVTGKIVLRSGY